MSNIMLSSHRFPMFHKVPPLQFHFLSYLTRVNQYIIPYIIPDIIPEKQIVCILYIYICPHIYIYMCVSINIYIYVYMSMDYESYPFNHHILPFLAPSQWFPPGPPGPRTRAASAFCRNVASWANWALQLQGARKAWPSASCVERCEGSKMGQITERDLGNTT